MTGMPGMEPNLTNVPRFWTELQKFLCLIFATNMRNCLWDRPKLFCILDKIGLNI